MTTASPSRFAKLALLGCLYLAQGLPFGFFVQALPTLLRQEGASYNLIASTSLLALPWALKFLWAPLIDRYRPPLLSRLLPGRWGHGHYRLWVMLLQACAVVVLLYCSTLSPADAFTPLFVAVFITNLVAATQDIATDALATHTLNDDERGLGNGVQVAGYRVGMVLSGGALLFVFDDIGWSGAFFLMAGAMALTTIPVALYTEAALVPDDQTPETLGAADKLVAFFRRVHMGRWLAVLVLYKFGDAFTNGLLRPFLVDNGYGLDDIGLIMGIVGFVTGLLGALAGGLVASRISRFGALLYCGAFQMLALWLYVPAAYMGELAQNIAYVSFATGVDHFAGGMATVALFTCMMDKAVGDDAGTAYTVQASVVVLAVGLANTLAGPSVQTFGHGVHFITGSLASLALLALSLKLARPLLERGAM